MRDKRASVAAEKGRIACFCSYFFPRGYMIGSALIKQLQKRDEHNVFALLTLFDWSRELTTLALSGVPLN